MRDVLTVVAVFGCAVASIWVATRRDVPSRSRLALAVLYALWGLAWFASLWIEGIGALFIIVLGIPMTVLIVKNSDALRSGSRQE